MPKDNCYQETDPTIRWVDTVTQGDHIMLWALTPHAVPWYSKGMRFHPIITLLVLLTAHGVSTGQGNELIELSSPVRRMYRTYCATCHGEDGDATGDAARFVFPKPRDFRSSAFRWVSSKNLVADKVDVIQSISRGIPGTSMQAWKSLGEEKLSQLADLVIQFRNAGARDKVRELLLLDGFHEKNSEELNTEGKVLYEEVIREKTVSSGLRAITLPPVPDAQAKESVETGSQLFKKLSCTKCHGERGQGSFKMDLFDDRGYPTFATDFRRDPIKSADDETMARVILFGLPGTSMPSSKISLTEVRDLISYIRSLAIREPHYLTNIQRYYRAIGFRRP